MNQFELKKVEITAVHHLDAFSIGIEQPNAEEPISLIGMEGTLETVEGRLESEGYHAGYFESEEIPGEAQGIFVIGIKYKEITNA